MKRSVSLLLFILSLVSSVPSFALVRELASCSAGHGRYGIKVVDNQGIGPVRTPHLFATISDEKGDVLVTYPAEVDIRPQPVSFRRFTYQDAATGGEQFSLAGPSTNVHTYSVRAKLPSGQIIADRNIHCRIFNGFVLR